jgi:predicted transcriptional regulator
VSEASQHIGGIIGCGWCETHVDGPCPECAKLRRRAVRLRARMDVDQIAGELGITSQRAARLLAQADQAAALEQTGAEMVPVSTLRRLYERRRGEDGQINESSLARESKMHRIDLRRALGLSPAKVRAGHSEPTMQEQVKLETAERIASALRAVPADITRM